MRLVELFGGLGACGDSGGVFVGVDWIGIYVIVRSTFEERGLIFLMGVFFGLYFFESDRLWFGVSSFLFFYLF